MITNVKQAKEIASQYTTLQFGLPEIIDRYNEWKVPILYNNNTVGEVYINATTGEINLERSTKKDLIEQRKSITKTETKYEKRTKTNLDNTVICGDSTIEMTKIPDHSIDLIFTSPPYYNARPQYQEYKTYQDYLDLMRIIIKEGKRVIISGKFFVVNVSHVLIPRSNRNQSSRRIAVPFDIHQLFMEEGYEFVDDIIWQKPEGAGWATGRGRRFAADRNPLQYKAVPTTEYVLVYRTDNSLIDTIIRNQDNLEESKIDDDYEKTNVWYISPSRSKYHPATFPLELAEKVIKYYSFKNDVILDPFAGIGTTGIAAIKNKRKYYLIEKEDKYLNQFKT